MVELNDDEADSSNSYEHPVCHSLRRSILYSTTYKPKHFFHHRINGKTPLQGMGAKL